MPPNTMSLEEYVKIHYPPPKENDPDFHFYACWGYEQYLIKRYKQNLDGLKILERSSYNQYRLSVMFQDADPEQPVKAIVGLPLVRAKHILSSFLTQHAVKGAIGVMLWEEDDGSPFCLFPRRTASPFGALMRSFSDDEIERLDQVFTSEEDVLKMQPMDRVCSQYGMVGHTMEIPDLGIVCVVKAGTGNVAGKSYPIQYVPAVPGTSKAWIRQPKAKKEWAYLKTYQLEDAQILQ